MLSDKPISITYFIWPNQSGLHLTFCGHVSKDHTGLHDVVLNQTKSNQNNEVKYN